jgi:hypothetical protein
MTLSLSSIKVQVILQATLSGVVNSGAASPDSASITQGLNFTPPTKLTSGVGANQADRLWVSEARALASGASESLDLFDLGSVNIGAGAGLDGLGQALNNTKIVTLCVVVDPSSAGKIILGGEGSGAAWNTLLNGSDTATICPIPGGGCFLIHVPDAAGMVVTDVTNYLLKVAASGGNCVYSIGFLSRDA